MPRIRPASRSGWNGSSASVFSPVPRNLTGRPVTALIESAAPPRASPSIFVRTRPVRGTAAANASATATASWPTIASTTRSVSIGRTAPVSSVISAMRTSSTVSRPAVSRMTVSRTSRRAASTPRRPICGTGVPCGAVTTGMSRPRPSVTSCSTAAGRYGSAATRIGRRPSFTTWRASLAAVVVLPEPWSPTRAMTAGLPERWNVRSPAERRSVSSSLTILTTCCPALRDSSTSAPTARSRTRATKSLTTRKLTSASRSARRTSRIAASTSASETRPRPVRAPSVLRRRSERASNMREGGSCGPDPAGRDGVPEVVRGFWRHRGDRSLPHHRRPASRRRSRRPRSDRVVRAGSGPRRLRRRGRPRRPRGRRPGGRRPSRRRPRSGPARRARARSRIRSRPSPSSRAW